VPLGSRDKSTRHGLSILARLRFHRSLLLLLPFVAAIAITLFHGLDRKTHLAARAIFKSRFQLTSLTRNASMSTGINALRIPAKDTHTATVIWLHGLGDSGHGWSFIGKYLDFPVPSPFGFCNANVLERQGIARVKVDTNIQYILPHAPNIPITINGGMRMPGWYDVKSLSDWNAPQDEPGMLKTVQLVHKLITEEVDAGINSDRIIVGGFSQGMLCSQKHIS
jgi:Phospholipase/Carboxylesterase